MVSSTNEIRNERNKASKTENAMETESATEKRAERGATDSTTVNEPGGPCGGLVLIGLRGAGKTTVGRKLAARLGCAFVDTDARVKKAAGCSIGALFAQGGESLFRRFEKQAVFALIGRPAPLVVATGGGAVLDPQNRRILNRLGLVVYLRAPVAVLLERLQSKDQNRPGEPSVVAGNVTTAGATAAAAPDAADADNDEAVVEDVEHFDDVVDGDIARTDRPPLTALDPKNEMREILKQREPLYLQMADLVLDATSPPAEVAEKLVLLWQSLCRLEAQKGPLQGSSAL
jgi:shikimate kinase